MYEKEVVNLGKSAHEADKFYVRCKMFSKSECCGTKWMLFITGYFCKNLISKPQFQLEQHC